MDPKAAQTHARLIALFRANQMTPVSARDQNLEIYSNLMQRCGVKHQERETNLI